MSNHTPGPWSIHNGTDIYSGLGSDSGDGYKCDARDGWHIAEALDFGALVDGRQTSLGLAVVEANARLIAASPDLLDAAKLALAIAESWIHDQMDGCKGLEDSLSHLDPVRAAIAKATQP